MQKLNRRSQKSHYIELPNTFNGSFPLTVIVEPSRGEIVGIEVVPGAATAGELEKLRMNVEVGGDSVIEDMSLVQFGQAYQPTRDKAKLPVKAEESQTIQYRVESTAALGAAVVIEIIHYYDLDV